MRSFTNYVVTNERFCEIFNLQNTNLISAIDALENLSKIISSLLDGKGLNEIKFYQNEYEDNSDIRQEFAFHTSMALMKRLIIDAQAKFRKMVEDNRQIVSRIDSDFYNPNDERIMTLNEELSDANHRLEQMGYSSSGSVKLGNNTNELSIQAPGTNNGIHPTSCSITGTSTVNSNVPQSSTESYRSGKSSRNCEDIAVSPITPHRYSQSHRASAHRNIVMRDNSSSSSSNGNGGNPVLESKQSNLVVDDTNYVNRRRSKKSRNRHSRRKTDIDFLEDTEPPSPTPGPSSRDNYAFLESNDRMAETISNTSSISLENDRLKLEIRDLRRLLVLQQHQTTEDNEPIDEADLTLYEDLKGNERIQALENEIIKARKIITETKNDVIRLKREKFNVYAGLNEKDKELRDYIRTYEARIRENLEMLTMERNERERERWSLLRHARDEAERSLALAAQLDIKDQQLQEVRRQLSIAGYFSDQESITSASTCTKTSRPINGRMTPNPVNNPITGIPDRGSCSADSGVRGCSDRESGATSTGGNLSDSTTDGTPTITIDNVHTHSKHRRHHRFVDADSISLISSSALPHIYQSVTTPRDCNSPSLSPMNMHSFSRALDAELLSKSVEHLCSPPPELEPIRRNKNLRSFGGRSGVSSTWGSISRVFSRNRHRKGPGYGSHDGDIDGYGRCWSPLTEEGYTDKLRLLREAAHVPMERWRAPTVLAWIEVALGMPQYGPRCADNIKSGKVLLELNDQDLETVLKITNPMHRKKLRLAIEENRNPSLIRYPCLSQLQHAWVYNEWLFDIGLPQYTEVFAKNMVDARMLENLSRREMEKYLNITRKYHQMSIIQGINLLRMVKYDIQVLAVRRKQCEDSDTDPLVWTNQRFIKWACDIHLGEYADNLKDCGIHGAVVVMEPTFDGDTMANALEIPTSKQMIRRHLSAELEQLILPSRYEAFNQSEPIYETPLYRAVQQ